jgi:hypothetical protein
MRDEVQSYLLSQMVTLCGGDNAQKDVDVDTCRAIEKLGLFDITTPFERIARTLGGGRVSSPRVIEGAPESMRLSIEHRYALSRWPAYEFVIFESEGGIAWGHTFVRRAGSVTPSIRQITDLDRWSHLESEVRTALGAPSSHEEWFPWASATYRLGGNAFALCYVYGLLQRVGPVADTNATQELEVRPIVEKRVLRCHRWVE